MKHFNFIRGPLRRKALFYWFVDISFVFVLSFIVIFSVSIYFSSSSQENINVQKYAQAQIYKLSRMSADYGSVKQQRDRLLDVASDMANIKASQYYILLGIEKMSRAVTDKIYITNINYVVASDMLILSGETQDLKLLSIFMKNLEIEFGVSKVDLKNLGTEKNGQRSFVLEFKFGEGNAFHGDNVK